MTAADSTAIQIDSPSAGVRLGRVLLRVGLGLLVLYALLLLVRNVTTLVDLQAARFDGSVEQGEFEDYVAFYAAGQLVLDGNGADIFDIEVLSATEREVMGREVGGTGTLAFFNPPFVALFFAPIAMLPIEVASFVLLAVNVGLVVIAGLILQRHLRVHGFWLSAVFWLAILTFESVYWLIAHNQLSMFLVLGFLGFFVFQRQERPKLSGLALALLLVKPQAALFALLIVVWKRQWDVLAPFAAVAGTLVLVSIIVSGPSVLWEYPLFLADSTGWEGSRGVDTAGMFGWNGFFATLASYGSDLHITLTTVATLVTLGAVAYSFRGRWNPRQPEFSLALACLILASILVNPHVYLQDAVLAGVALALGHVGWSGRRPRSIWLALAITTWFLLTRTMGLQAGQDLNLITPLLAGLLAILTVVVARRPSSGVEATPKTPQYELAESGVAS